MTQNFFFYALMSWRSARDLMVLRSYFAVDWDAVAAARLSPREERAVESFFASVDSDDNKQLDRHELLVLRLAVSLASKDVHARAVKRAALNAEGAPHRLLTSINASVAEESLLYPLQDLRFLGLVRLPLPIPGFRSLGSLDLTNRWFWRRGGRSSSGERTRGARRCSSRRSA